MMVSSPLMMTRLRQTQFLSDQIDNGGREGWDFISIKIKISALLDDLLQPRVIVRTHRVNIRTHPIFAVFPCSADRTVDDEGVKLLLSRCRQVCTSQEKY